MQYIVLNFFEILHLLTLITPKRGFSAYLVEIFAIFVIMNDKYIYELSLKVRDYEVDAEGIVNNANYLHYLEHTRHEFCEQAGFSFRDMRERGLTPVVARVEIKYLHSLGLGDSMISKLALSRRGPVFVFHQDIYTPSGDPVIKAIVDIACYENGRLSRGQALAEAFAKYLNEE